MFPKLIMHGWGNDGGFRYPHAAYAVDSAA